MKSFLYVTFDRDLKVFEQPFFSPCPKTDIKEAYRRQFAHDPSKAYESHLDCKDLYCLGEYDELEGQIAQNKEFMFDIREVLPPRNPNAVDDINMKLDILLKRINNGGSN